MKKVLLWIVGIIAAICIAVACIWGGEIRTLKTVTTVNGNEYLWQMEYKAAYDLDDLITKDIDSNAKLLEYVIGRVGKGLPIKIKSSQVADENGETQTMNCTSFQAAQADGDGFWYGRNYDYYKNYLIHVDLALEPNTTGHTRWGNVMVKSYDYEGAGLYVQFPFLNITHPNPDVNDYYGDNYNVPDGADFILRDSADFENDSLCFNVQKSWTLSFAPGADQSWLQLSTTSGEEGYNVVPIKLEQNLTTKERRTELILTSSGISNQISVVQSKAKK